MELGVVIVWLALAICLGFLADSRGRSGIGWGLCAFILSPLLLLIVLLCMADLKKQQLESDLVVARNRQTSAQPALSPWASPSPPAAPGPVFAPQAASRAASAPASPEIAPQLIATELERLSALVDRGRLTDDEYGEMKRRLLGGSVAASQVAGIAAPERRDSAIPDSDRVAADGIADRRAGLMHILAEPERAVPRLEAYGCKVRQIDVEEWEVIEPSGITAYCRSREALRNRAVDFAMGRST